MCPFLTTWLKCSSKMQKRHPKNAKIFIYHMEAQVGASRFEFSTKFWVSRCWKNFGNIWKRSDFSLPKSTILLGESAPKSFEMMNENSKILNFVKISKVWGKLILDIIFLYLKLLVGPKSRKYFSNTSRHCALYV